MKKTPLNKIGKIGKANIEARKRIAEIAEEENIVSCEIKLPGCKGNFGLAPAHRHKREWYKGDADKLSDPNQWVGACEWCHNIIEKDKKKTEEIFLKLREEE